MNSISEVRVVAPKFSYGKDSLKVKGARKNPSETQLHLQEIASFYNDRGIAAYLIYAHKKESQLNLSGYHVIPYPENEFWLFQQIRVLWRVTFGPCEASEKEKRGLERSYCKKKESQSLIEESVHIQDTLSLLDPFCKEEQIAKQSVFEGKHINVLLNFAPLVNGEDEFHILLIPKEHYTTWSNMPAEIFQEGEQMTLALTGYFSAFEIYTFIKNGKRAGQSQDHCHKHFIVVANGKNAFFGKLSILRKMLLGGGKLSEKDLELNVNRVCNLISPALEGAEH